MDALHLPRRTRVVDLGLMSREDVIEVAKKQAQGIREKTMRIKALEDLVAQLTGRPAPDVASTGLSPNQSYTGSLPATPAEHRSELALQQAMEEERIAYATEISRNEQLTRELQTQLDTKTAELTALQDKVNVWREKVMLTSRRDQEIIAQLQARLGQLQSTTITAATPAAISPDVLEAAVQEKLSHWKERVKTKMQQDMDRIHELEERLKLIQNKNQSPSKTVADTVQRKHITPSSQLSQQEPHDVFKTQEATHTDMEEAPHQIDEQKKEHVLETIQADKIPIKELHQELQAPRSGSTECNISFETPTDVVHSIGVAAVSELKHLQKNMAFRELSNEQTIHSLTQEVQRLKVELERARREQEEAAGAMETMQCDAAREREEAVATLAQEVQRLKWSWRWARREQEEAADAMETMQCDAARERE
ncbi:hypothetical protein TraAM80_07340, partial [Trypanosoma rangeli]